MKKTLMILAVLASAVVSSNVAAQQSTSGIGSAVGSGAISGAALNTQQNNNNQTTDSHNLQNSNNGSGNSTIHGGSAAGGTLINQAQAPGTQVIKNITTPQAIAPNITTSGLDTCLGSVSGGGSVTGFGVSFGSTKVDENCVMIKQVKILAELGLKDAAVARMLQDEKLAKALLIAYPQFKRLTAHGSKELAAEIPAVQPQVAPQVP